MSARLSLFQAIWDAARMPLALPAHVPVFRVPPCERRVRLRADPHEEILPLNVRGGGFILFMPPGGGWGHLVPETVENWPSVVVDTTPEWMWHDPVAEARALETQSHESTFFFGDRAGFERAYRAARTIAAGRPAFDVIFGGRSTYNDHPWRPSVKMFSVLGMAHQHLTSYELHAAHEGPRGVTHFGWEGSFAQTVCRVCGRGEEAIWTSGHHFDEPDLCSLCRGRETDEPCEGFGGTCDRCLHCSHRLRLVPLTSFAMCRYCRQGKPLPRPHKKGGR